MPRSIRRSPISLGSRSRPAKVSVQGFRRSREPNSGASSGPRAGRNERARRKATLPDGSTKTVRADYDVVESGSTVAIGAKAPSVETPTIVSGGDIRAVSHRPAAGRKLLHDVRRSGAWVVSQIVV